MMFDGEGARDEPISAMWRIGRTTWPQLELDYPAFADWLSKRLEPAQDPRALCAADLYLAASCLLGIAGAASALIDRYMPEVERHSRHILASPEARAELRQDLTVQLLTPGPDGSPPRLSQYSGRGALAVWLRMMIVRRALNLTRKKSEVIDHDHAAFERALEADPELSIIRRRHKDEIAAIFRDASAATPPEERTLLRLHYVDGSTLQELAALYRTSRSSLHRRLDAARGALMERIAELVRQRLNLEESQRMSMLRVFKSQLAESLGKLLREEG